MQAESAIWMIDRISCKIAFPAGRFGICRTQDDCTNLGGNTLRRLDEIPSSALLIGCKFDPVTRKPKNPSKHASMPEDYDSIKTKKLQDSHNHGKWHNQKE